MTLEKELGIKLKPLPLKSNPTLETNLELSLVVI